MKFVTIDWDFFFNDDIDHRDSHYPDCTDGRLYTTPNNSLWKPFLQDEETSYSLDYELLLETVFTILTRDMPFTEVTVSENHGAVKSEIDRVVALYPHPQEKISILNLDFHHDYCYQCSEVTCANWFRLVDEEHGDKIEKLWVKRETSDTQSFGVDVPVKVVDFSTFKEYLSTADFIHICRSDLYSPPIFDKYFDMLIKLIKSKSASFMEVEELEKRI